MSFINAFNLICLIYNNLTQNIKISYNKTMEIKYIIILAVVFLILIMIGLAIVNYSGEELVEKLKKLSVLPCGISSVELANILNYAEFGGKIKIKFADKYFSDCMSSSFVLTLSNKYSNTYNFAGLTICAHELGHAFQFRDKMDKMRKRGKITKISKVLLALFNPLIIAGIIFLFAQQDIIGYILLGFAGLFFLIAVVAKIYTIGIEKEASKNALNILKIYASFTDEELKIANKFLKAAKMTYIGDLLKMMLKWTGFVRR